MHNMQKYSNKKAFTLAEVLITLTIIGVIAALTIPALIQNINDQDLRTQWKSAYSMMDQASKRVLMENGGSFKGVFSNSTDIRDKFKGYLNHTKECAYGTTAGNCWPSQIFRINGTSVSWTDLSGIILNNGMFVRFGFMSNDCSGNMYYTTGECGSIQLDVNGFKGPNMLGKDIYYIHILPDGIRPAGVAESTSSMSRANCSSEGPGCGALYLQQ